LRLLRESEICVALDRSRVVNIFTEHLKHFNHNFDHGTNFQFPPAGLPASCVSLFLFRPVMHSSDFEQSSDYSGAGDDPHQSSTVPNSLLQLQGDYASGSDDVVPCSPEKQFEKEDWQSDCSEFHTPAQQYKRQRLPSVSLLENRQV
jgi:hypothetical protein